MLQKKVHTNAYPVGQDNIKIMKQLEYFVKIVQKGMQMLISYCNIHNFLYNWI